MEYARELRRRQTDAEARLWSRVRAGQLGVKFRRQHRVDGYILDFVCLERRLAIELDGGQHGDQIAYDARRTAALERFGLRVIRFWNDDVLLRTDDVLAAIVHALHEPLPPHPNPLPRQRRGRGSKAGAAAVGTTATGAPESRTIEARTTEANITEANITEANTMAGGTSAAGAVGAGTEPERDGRRGTALRLRARLNAAIREFFAGRGVLEVETPVLSRAGNTEPNIEGFTTTFTGPVAAGARTRYLRTSAEYPMKRLLAAGFGDCYELGRVFRNGEVGRHHNPEFTMLEWYRVGFDHRRIALECAQLVRMALALAGRESSVTTTTYREWFAHGIGIDPFTADAAALREPLREYSITPDGLTRDDWLDLLVTHRLQPALPENSITIVYDFPASQCSLARIRPGSPPVAERFELYVGRHELANGYHELNDATEQRARFEFEQRRRRERGQEELEVDENLLAVLDRLPDCAGVALGVDRLLMHLAGTDDIGDVIGFPFAEA